MKTVTSLITITILLLMGGNISCCGKSLSSQPEPYPMPIVFDTDMGPDYDDVGALAVLHAFADCGYANILATVSSNKMEKTTQLICLINTYFKRPDILIGVTKDENAKNSDTWHKGAKWTEELLKKYPFDQAVASESEDAVKVYRKVLAGQDDGSVTIISVGFFTNLKNLLQSPPDEISSLPGRELVARKVNKLVSMACLFPEGREYNAASDAASIKYVVENWSAPIVFSGAEIGRYIRTGDKLIEKAGNGPVKEAYAISIAQDMLELDNSRYEMGGRASYDQTAVLAAVFGDKYFNLEKGTVFISEDGSNQWEMDTNGKHTILKHKYSFQKLACIIENQMMHEPTENKHR